MPIQLAGNVKLWRSVRGGLRPHARRAGRRHRRRHRERPPGARGPGRRAARRLFPACAVRHAVRLRGLRGARRADRAWRHRRVRRHRGHGPPGPLRDGVLRHRVLREMHAVPDRRDPRRRGDRPHHPRRAARREHRAGRGPLQDHEVRLALRARRLHALPGHERAPHFPEDFGASPRLVAAE